MVHLYKRIHTIYTWLFLKKENRWKCWLKEEILESLQKK